MQPSGATEARAGAQKFTKVTDMALSEYPGWVLAHKGPGTEIRQIRGKYYLYRCSSFYDPETKRTRKKTGEYLGRITEEGLVPRRAGTPGDYEARIRGLESRVSELTEQVCALERENRLLRGEAES